MKLGLLGASVLLVCTGCLFSSPVPSLDELRIGEVREPELLVRTTRHPGTGIVVREWSEWSHPKKHGVRHGSERTWYPSGAPEWEREFDQGEPVGHWQGWYEDGTPMAESFHGTPAPTRMSFWHANGQLSAQGSAYNGVRVGPWTHWFENGSVREEGEYSEGRRAGEWSFFSSDGELVARGGFERGVRVGSWESGEAPSATAE